MREAIKILAIRIEHSLRGAKTMNDDVRGGA